MWLDDVALLEWAFAHQRRVHDRVLALLLLTMVLLRWGGRNLVQQTFKRLLCLMLSSLLLFLGAYLELTLLC